MFGAGGDGFFLGERDDAKKHAKFDQKFIGVDEGGTLEIHGEKRTSWTKLAKTLKAKTVIFDNDGEKGVKKSHLEVREFAPNGTLRNIFSTIKDVGVLESTLNGLASDSVVILSKYTNFNNKFYKKRSEIKEKVNSVLGASTNIDQLADKMHAWTMIVDRSDPGSAVEAFGTEMLENGGFATEMIKLDSGMTRFMARSFTKNKTAGAGENRLAIQSLPKVRYTSNRTKASHVSVSLRHVVRSSRVLQIQGLRCNFNSFTGYG